MRPITEDYTFPARDQRGAVIPEGRTVSAIDLEAGRMAYVSFCASCHGLDGDGRGPDATDMSPPPRDFRRAVFKFAAVRSGELAGDDDLLRIIRDGLSGTEMPPWGLDEQDIVHIIDFLKTFPPSGCGSGGTPEGEACARSGRFVRKDKDGRPKERIGEPIRSTEDPWEGRHAEALRRGEIVYHGAAQCTACHPSYLTESQRASLLGRSSGARTNGHAPLTIAADKSPYGVDITAPDFTKSTMRSVRKGRERQDLYRVVASGVGGVMPSWIDALPEEDIWALAHYVMALAEGGPALGSSN